MVIKLIYNNLFSLSSYKENSKKSLLYSIGYTVIITVLCGILMYGICYNKVKPYLDAQIETIYEKVPDFSLSSQGLDIEGDGIYNFRFAGMSFYINDNKTFLSMIIDDGVDKDDERTYIGKDGFGIVNGSKLKDAEYFKNMVLLEKQVLAKDDFRIIYETIRLINNDILLLLYTIAVVMFLCGIFIKNIIYTVLVKSICKIKQKEITFKEAYKLSLFCQTFYIVYFGIVMFSSMNLIIPIKVLTLEIISLIYICLLGLNYNIDYRGTKHEGYKKKKRH